MSLAGLLIHLFFFASGFTALVYEVLWERSLRLAFGVSTYSVAVVTAAFMGGLAIGYWSGRARRLERFHPLRIYAAAEAGIALYALAFPWLLAGVDAVYVASGGWLAVRAMLAFALLLPPTALMGLTLPVVARAFPGARSAGRIAGGLFAANTAGAVAGALAAGWYLVRLFGAARTTEITTATNLAIAALAALASLRIGVALAQEETDRPGTGRSHGITAAVLVVAAFVAGFQTMGLQVVWNRTLVCVVENNTTSFALILAAVLLGSAAGALFYSMIGGRSVSGRRALGLFVGAALFLGVYTVGSIEILNRLYGLAGAIQEAFPIRSVAGLAFVRLLAVLAPIAPVAAAGAFLVPALVDLLRDRMAGDEGSPGPPDRSRAISTVFAADALGSVCGSLAAGFLLVPVLGLGGTMVALATLALVVAAGVVLAAGERRLFRIGLPAVAVAGVAALLLVRPLTLTRWYDGHQKIAGDLLLYEEGAFGTIAVFQVGATRDLLINCIEEVPNHRDALLLFRILGHAPLLIHGDAEQVLVNALGGGITLGSVVRHDVEVEAVELVPEVKKAMALFAEENGNALAKGNWRLIHDDGRNYLRLSPRRYDVITADATHPAAGESWPLYTKEYYAIVRDHLAPGGLFAQWLPLHNMAPEDFRAALATFRAAFPDMLVFFVQRYSVLLGGLERIGIDPEAITRRMRANPEVAADLGALGIQDAGDLLRYLVLDADGVDRLTEGAGILTDDRASVEYAELHRLDLPQTFPLDLALLTSAFEPAALAERTGLPIGIFWARERLMRAQLRLQRGTFEAVFASLMDLEEARALAPGDPDLGEPIERLRDSLVRYVKSEHEELLSRPDLENYLEVLDYARHARPDDPFLFQMLGAALLRLERYGEAVPPLEEAVRLRPRDPTYLSNLTFAYERSGRPEDALRTLDRLTEVDPGNPALETVRARLEEGARKKGAQP